MEINTEMIHNGVLALLNNKVKVYFETIEELQNFFALWQKEGEPMDAGEISRLIKKSKNKGLPLQ